MFLNPRAELRIPLGSSVETALFLDAGNLWTDPARVNAFELRYAVGTGLRIATPIGPLVFDYGFNVDRVLDELFPKSRQQAILGGHRCLPLQHRLVLTTRHIRNGCARHSP